VIALLAAIALAAPTRPSGPVEPLPFVGLEELDRRPLEGLTIYLSPGHGKLLDREEDGRPVRWRWQRQPTNGMREDEWTRAYCAEHFVPALESAGARVISLRELDPHLESVEVEESDEAFSAFGTSEVADDTAASDGKHRVLAPDAQASWTLTLPADGRWRLVTRWVAAPDRDRAARYAIELPDGEVVEVSADQTVHGGHVMPLTWVEGSRGDRITVVLDGSGEGSLSADMVRLGGGTYRPVAPGIDDTEVLPWSDISVVDQLEHTGGPRTLFRHPDGRPMSDPKARSTWTNWASPPGEDNIFISVHTNAMPRPSTGRGGTWVFYGNNNNPPRPSRPPSMRLAQSVVDALWPALRAVDPEWPTVAPREGAFTEISTFDNELDGILIEVGFHDHEIDAEKMNDALFRHAFTQGFVEGIVRWRIAERALRAAEPTPPADEPAAPATDTPEISAL
jgi:N-acetylmuramoyl-L-alanine amidase